MSTSVQDIVQQYYGKVLTRSEDLQTNACCATGAPPERILEALGHVHPDVSSRFYGCGYPVPEALDGATVVDLGCGTGRDVFVIAQMVGPKGRSIGLDMTEEQLAVARRTEEWHRERFGFAEKNTDFQTGKIEDLSFLPDASVDVVVSNCVVNLSARKDLVVAEVFRVLKPGGEFYLSDVFCDRRLPQEIARDPLLYAECLGGAMVGFDFEQLAKRVGFLDPRTVERGVITIANRALQKKVGAARFESVTLRLLKLAALEPRCEDFGQVAVYRREMPGVGPLFELRPERVCSNTAMMLSDTRFGAYFDVIGDTSVHYGLFDCGPTMASKQYAAPTDPAACC